MGKRKSQKKKKTKQTPPLSPEEEIQIQSLLQDGEGLTPDTIADRISSPSLARALVERLPLDHPHGPDLVLTIRNAFDSKRLKKSAKTWFFKRKQRGLSVPDLDSRGETPLKVMQTPESAPEAFMGPVDGFGSRAVFITIPQVPQGVDVGLGIVNDREGIVEFIFGRYSKKRMREVKALFFEQTGLMVETRVPHACTILEKAYGPKEGSMDASANGYRRLRPWLLENIELLESAAVYDDLAPDSITKDILTGSQIKRLLAHPLMQSWIIDPEKIASILEEIQNAKESPILVSEEQKAARISEIKESAVSSIYPDSERARLKSRLEEMAYVFLKSEGEEYARLALAAALTLDEGDSILAVNPFLMALMDRTLDLYSRAAEQAGPPKPEEETDKPSSIIIP